MDFLYFPEDKTEYIGSFIVLVIFMAGAVAAMYFFYKKSKKEEEYYEEKFKDKDADGELLNEESSEEKRS